MIRHALFGMVAISASTAVLAWGAEPRLTADSPTPALSVDHASGVRARLGFRPFLHGDYVTQVAYTSDGRHLVTLGGDRAIVVWDARTGAERHRFTGFEPFPHGFTISPDSRELLVMRSHQPSRRFRLSDGAELPSIGGPQTPCERALYSNDSKFLVAVSGGWSGKIQWWDVESRTQLDRFPVVREPIFSLAFSSDGRTLATAREGSTLRLWDVTAGTERRKIDHDAPWVFSLAFSPDDRWLASSDSNKRVHVWDVASGKLERTFVGHTDAVNRVMFLPGGRELLSSAADGTVRIWEVETGKELRSIRFGPAGVSTSALAVSPDGATLVVGNSMRFFDLASGQEREQAPNGGGVCAWSKDGRQVLTGSSTLLRCDAATGEILGRYKLPEFHAAAAAGFADDDRQVICATKYGRLLGWDADTGRATSSTDIASSNSIAVSPDGRRTAVGQRDDEVTLYDSLDPRRFSTLAIPRGKGAFRSDIGVGAMAWSEDGRSLVISTFRNRRGMPASLRLWDVEPAGVSWRELALAPDSTQRAATAVAISPDGRWVAASLGDGMLRMWETLTSRECFATPEPQSIAALAFSPDGRQLVVAAGATVRCVPTWAPDREIRRLAHHRDTVQRIAFSPDGSRLATSARDGLTLICDGVAAGQFPPLLAGRMSREDARAALANPYSVQAFVGMAELAATPEGLEAFLADGVRPATNPVSRTTLDELIRRLDSTQRREREEASAKLIQFGRWARRALMEAPSTVETVEGRQRAAQILARIEGSWPSPTEFIALRSLALLEYVATPAARALVEDAARGDPEALLTAAAAQTLARWPRPAAN